jgi:hypothetical protein
VPLTVRHIDREQAELVAGAFLEAPRTSTDPLVLAAYAQLATQAAEWFALLTGSRARAPIRIVHTRTPEPYASGEELAERVRVEQILELSPARPHPLLDTSPGGAYDRVRAVHDLVSHAWLGHGFDRHGEFSGWLVEGRGYRGLARWALATELHGEHSVRWTTGDVAEHKATLLAPWILRASLRPAGRDLAGCERGQGRSPARPPRAHERV